MLHIGNHLTVLNLVDSTNNYAMQKVHAGLAEHGHVWAAVEQTAGKGQWGKTWQANAGENMMISIAMDTTGLLPTYSFELSAMVALACYHFFSKIAGTKTSIKWPNDLYYADNKAGGILIENVKAKKPTAKPALLTSAKSWNCAIVGIGININQTSFAHHIPNPISLKQITGHSYELMALIIELCQCLDVQWRRLLAGNRNEILNEYNQHLYKRGQKVRLRKNNVVMPCTIKGVSEKGKLLIMEDDTVAFNFGEISWEMF